MKLFAAALALLAAVAVPAARAVPSPAVVITYFQYLPGQPEAPIEIIEGSELLVTHQDPVAATFYTPWHDITSRAVDPSGAPLFASPLLGFGETAPVDGVADLPPERHADRARPPVAISLETRRAARRPLVMVSVEC